MKEIITEWRKFVKEAKTLKDVTKDLMSNEKFGQEFRKGMERAASRREKSYLIIKAFIENSHEVNNIFQESLKYMAEHNFDITNLFRLPDGKYTKEDVARVEKFWDYAKRIVIAIGVKIKEIVSKSRIGYFQVFKDFGLPSNPNLREYLEEFENDAISAQYSDNYNPKSVWNVAHFLAEVGHDLSKDPEKVKYLSGEFEPEEMETYEAPVASDMEQDDFELDAAKKIRKHDPEAWKKEINEKKKRR